MGKITEFMFHNVTKAECDATQGSSCGRAQGCSLGVKGVFDMTV